MLTFLTFVGIGCLLAAVAAGIFRIAARVRIPYSIIGALALSGAILVQLPGLTFDAAPGYSYLVQYPWGTQISQMTPGIHPRFYGNKIDWKKYATVAFAFDTKGIGNTFSGVRPSKEIRFNDSVTADVQMTARFELPTDPDRFKEMALAYRSQDNLINSTLFPVIEEALRNAGRMFSAQQYIGGRGGDFENAVKDQIENGIYLLEVNESEGVEKPIAVEGQRTINEGRTSTVQVRIRRDKEGNPLRKDANGNPLTMFGIRVVQANIQSVDPDPDFKAKLKEQRDAAAQVAIERQNTLKEEQKKLRIIAQGESEKASTRVVLEQRQIEEVVAAETEAKKAVEQQRQQITVATTALREAEIAKQTKEVEVATAKLEAARITALADANAYEREKLLKADNALSIRLQTYERVMEKFAKALDNKQLVPSVVIGGTGSGTQNSAMDLVNLLTAQVAKDLGANVAEGSKK